VNIKVRRDGPYLVTGACTVTDHQGNRIEVPDNFVLCRCGASARKPFCDGSHRQVEFRDPKD
jgi:CDGSH-type Zn-finger protein